MADQTISITIPDAKVSAVITGFLKLYPNIEKNPDGSAKYNNKDWIKEVLRRIIVRDTRRGLQVIANETGNIQEDDSMAV